MQEKISPAANFFARRGAPGICACGEVPERAIRVAPEKPVKPRLDGRPASPEVDRRQRWP
jgi:hypothetical protein